MEKDLTEEEIATVSPFSELSTDILCRLILSFYRIGDFKRICLSIPGLYMHLTTKGIRYLRNIVFPFKRFPKDGKERSYVQCFEIDQSDIREMKESEPQIVDFEKIMKFFPNLKSLKRIAPRSGGCVIKNDLGIPKLPINGANMLSGIEDFDVEFIVVPIHMSLRKLLRFKLRKKSNWNENNPILSMENLKRLRIETLPMFKFFKIINAGKLEVMELRQISFDDVNDGFREESDRKNLRVIELSSVQFSSSPFMFQKYPNLKKMKLHNLRDMVIQDLSQIRHLELVRCCRVTFRSDLPNLTYLKIGDNSEVTFGAQVKLTRVKTMIWDCADDITLENQKEFFSSPREMELLWVNGCKKTNMVFAELDFGPKELSFCRHFPDKKIQNIGNLQSLKIMGRFGEESEEVMSISDLSDLKELNLREMQFPVTLQKIDELKSIECHVCFKKVEILDVPKKLEIMTFNNSDVRYDAEKWKSDSKVSSILFEDYDFSTEMKDWPNCINLRFDGWKFIQKITFKNCVVDSELVVVKNLPVIKILIGVPFASLKNIENLPSLEELEMNLKFDQQNKNDLVCGNTGGYKTSFLAKDNCRKKIVIKCSNENKSFKTLSIEKFSIFHQIDIFVGCGKVLDQSFLSVRNCEIVEDLSLSFLWDYGNENGVGINLEFLPKLKSLNIGSRYLSLTSINRKEVGIVRDVGMESVLLECMQKDIQNFPIPVNTIRKLRVKKLYLPKLKSNQKLPFSNAEEIELSQGSVEGGKDDLEERLGLGLIHTVKDLVNLKKLKCTQISCIENLPNLVELILTLKKKPDEVSFKNLPKLCDMTVEWIYPFRYDTMKMKMENISLLQCLKIGHPPTTFGRKPGILLTKRSCFELRRIQTCMDDGKTYENIVTTEDGTVSIEGSG